MDITFIVLQLERGEEGTLHYQGYLESSKSVRFTKFKKHEFFEKANFGKCDGTPQQNVDYCTKEESREPTEHAGPFMWGELSKQGQRTDLVKLRDAVRSGKRGRDLFDDDELCGSAIKYVRGVSAMAAAYNEAKPRDNVVVTFHYGDPGLGKTYCCASDDAYYFDGNNGFWNGYKVCLSSVFFFLTHNRERPRSSSTNSGGILLPPSCSNVFSTNINLNAMSRETLCHFKVVISTSQVTTSLSHGGVRRPSLTDKLSTVVYL